MTLNERARDSDKTVMGFLLQLLVVILAAAPASSGAAHFCLTEFREIFGKPKNHVVHADADHVQMAPEFLKATEEVYDLLPDSFVRPERLTLDLIGKKGHGSFCVTTEGKIVCETLLSDSLYARRGAEVLKNDLGVHTHELGHLVSYANYHKTKPALTDFLFNEKHPFFETELDAAVKASDQATHSKLEYDAVARGTNQKLADLRYQAWESAKARFEKAKQAFLDKRQFWRAYDEVFADLIAVAWSKDPKIIARGTRDSFGRMSEARDFSVQRGIRGWRADNVHDQFAPVRSHLWSRYLEKDPSAATKVIGATHRAMLREIEATLADPKLFELSLGEKNQRFIDEIDRQMAASKSP